VEHDVLVSLLGTAAGMMLAAVSALWKLFRFVLELDRAQSEARHRVVNETTAQLVTLEARLTTRIERVEEQSHGFQRWQADRLGGDDGE
jgi:hypothetical protein